MKTNFQTDFHISITRKKTIANYSFDFMIYFLSIMKSTISSNLDGMLLVNALVKFNGKKVQTTMQNSVIKIVFIGPSRKKCFHL